MARDPIPTWYFALTVVRQGRRILLVHERKHGQTWYLPAGRVEPGETLAEAAKRETLEESGISIELEGVLRIEHTPSARGQVRCRAFFIARPSDDTPPLNAPNAHALEARWVAYEELDGLNLRGPEVRKIFEYVLRGGPSYPLSVLQLEGQTW